MTIYPAIDILNGKCVRLTQGSYDEVTGYRDNPLDAAKEFIDAMGAYMPLHEMWLHVVDLDGAKNGEPANNAVIEQICNLGCKVQTGGGNRTAQHIADKAAMGVSRVILGTSALDSDFIRRQVMLHGDKIAVGIDARDNIVAVSGWLQSTQTTALDLAKAVDEIGVRTIIYTDISRDGMMKGVNATAMSEMANTVSCNIIASGGVSTLDDITALCSTKVSGAIIGKALYTGAIKLEQAIALARNGGGNAGN